MKLHDIIYDKDCYVYSTSYRFCISPFAFAPSTTIGPTDGDFNRAINITGIGESGISSRRCTTKCVKQPENGDSAGFTDWRC
jgi:hypothetical protein